MNYICPVCKYNGLDEPAYSTDGYGSDEICPCCGFQFGYDDLPQFENLDGQFTINYPYKDEAFKKWRTKWILSGCHWYSDHILAPQNWNVENQINMIEEEMP